MWHAYPCLQFHEDVPTFGPAAFIKIIEKHSLWDKSGDLKGNVSVFIWACLVQAFFDFRSFDFRDFQFNTIYCSILFLSLLGILSNLDLRGFCFRGF